MFIHSLVRSHRSLVRLLRTARCARALTHCAHSLASELVGQWIVFIQFLKSFESLCQGNDGKKRNSSVNDGTRGNAKMSNAKRGLSKGCVRPKKSKKSEQTQMDEGDNKNDNQDGDEEATEGEGEKKEKKNGKSEKEEETGVKGLKARNLHVALDSVRKDRTKVTIEEVGI